MKCLNMALAAVLVVALAGCAARDADREERDIGQLETQTATGTVVSRTNQALVLTTEDDERLSLLVDDRSQMPEQIRAGDRVEVQYENVGENSRRLLWARLDEDQADRAGEVFQGRDVAETGEDRDVRAPGTVEQPVPERRVGDPPAESAQRQVEQPQRVDREYAQRESPGVFPGTASPAPLAGAVGVAAMGAGLALRWFRRRG